MAMCKVCSSMNSESIEEVGTRAVEGVISWRAAERELAALGHVVARASLQNHMETHYFDKEVREVESEFDAAIAEGVADLFQAMRFAPPEVKPLYAAAIRNLQGLKDTKPSQQHLIMALKTIQEMTGMKQEQRMLLQFAEQMFHEIAARPEASVIDVVEIPALTPASYAEEVNPDGYSQEGSHQNR